MFSETLNVRKYFATLVLFAQKLFHILIFMYLHVLKLIGAGEKSLVAYRALVGALTRMNTLVAN